MSLKLRLLFTNHHNGQSDIYPKHRQLEIKVTNKIEADQIIKIAPFKKELRKTSPHRHDNYLEIIYLSRGSGLHYIDQCAYKIDPPILFVVRKEQVHHWDMNEQAEGYVIILKKRFIEHTLDQELRFLLGQISTMSCLVFPDPGNINTLFALLSEEYGNTKAGSFTIVEGLLKALLAKIIQTATPISTGTKSDSGLYDTFAALLQSENTVRNNVSHYAGLLHTTPQNLNHACRKATGLTAGQVLQAWLLSEARRLLVYTGLSITEIAYRLEFTDASHFIRYFRKATGHTPGQYRQQ